MRRSLFLLASCALVASACDRAPTSPAARTDAGAAPLAAVWSGGPDKVVTVMTRNLYLGASIDPMIAALVQNPASVPVVAAQTWAVVQGTNFPARAGRLAAEIVAADPELVGLQEVSLWRTGPVLSPAPAEDVVYDFLDLLLDSLAARGASYEAVATSVNTDVEVPSAIGRDIRLTDRDVIIAKAKLPVFNAQDGRYQARLQFPLPTGGVLPAPRGWTSVDVKIRGESFRFFNTHLETEQFAPAQVGQAVELLGILAASPLPVIAVGDFNSDADGGSTPTYAMLTGAGFLDAWPQVSEDAGLTCCHNETLTNPTAAFHSRIDLVLTRGLPGAVAAQVVGDDPADRTAGGLWPSDHAGVVAVVRLR